MHRAAASCLLALVAFIAAGASHAAQTRPFTVHDLLAMQRISDPQVSPNGRQVAFVVRTTDLEANRGRTDLWIVNTEGGVPRRLTTHEAGDSEPRWSPDGRWIYFLSTRSGTSQVWRIAADGGEAAQVTDLPVDVGSLVVSPDGRRLAFAAEVFVDCETVACTADRVKAGEERKATGRLYEKLFVRHWDSWKDGRRSHLFSVALGSEGKAAGEPVDLARGLDADVPSKPFGGGEEVAFSPDGRWVVFTARDAGREEAWSTDHDLFLVPAEGGAPPKNLTDDNPAWDTQPVFSPDGKTLAYLAMARPGYEADRFRVVLRPMPDGAPRVLTEGWDRSPDKPVWSSDGATLFATAGDLGRTALFAIDAASGEARRVIEGGTVRSPALGRAADGSPRLVFGRDHLRSPVELYSAGLDGSGERRLTDFNGALLAQVELGTPEQFTFPGWNGETVHAWVVKPVGFDAGKKYPVAFLIHGGPQGSFGDDFHYRWNPQTYAGAGYAAVMVDFHGSTGYGQAFTDAIQGDWGGKPLEDLRKGLAAAAARYPWLDTGRSCALGASYGGYMINWIAGRWNDGFRCLVNHDGIFDQRMMYYATEELWFPEWEHGGPHFAVPGEFEKHNPLAHVADWKTPMLVVHGALDYRVPETQGIATFSALQRRGIPSQLLHFPDENHWVLKPANSVLWHETVLAWLDRWLR